MPHAPNIVISQLDCAAYMVLFRMVQNRLCTLDIAGCRLYLYKRTLAFVTNHKVHFQPGILVEIVELSSHFGENIRDQILKDSSFVAIEIALKNVILGAVLQHTDKQPHIPHIHLECVLLGIAIQRKSVMERL